MLSPTSMLDVDALTAKRPKRGYSAPMLTNLGLLSRVTLAGMGTVAERGYFYTPGAAACTSSMMAMNVTKYPCG